MKTTFLVVVFFVFSCFPPHSPASPTRQLEYSTAYLMQWVADCIDRLNQILMQQGLHPIVSQQQAGMQCACVIDGFRLNYTQSEVANMTPADRGLFAQHFAKQCLGITNDSNEPESVRPAGQLYEESRGFPLTRL